MYKIQYNFGIKLQNNIILTISGLEYKEMFDVIHRIINPISIGELAHSVSIDIKIL